MIMTDDEKNERYKTVCEIQASSQSGSVCVRLQVIADRALTKDDEENARDATGEFLSAFDMETAKLDPKTAEVHDATRGKLRNLFDSPIYMEEIPNEYWGVISPYSLASPWFIVTTAVGHFKVGWRKNVLVIDWSHTVGTEYAHVLFSTEDVTQSDKMIHAWGYEKAKQYIAKIMESANG